MFITLHSIYDNQDTEFIINADNISEVYVDGSGAVLISDSDQEYSVRESLDDIKEKLGAK